MLRLRLSGHARVRILVRHPVRCQHQRWLKWRRRYVAHAAKQHAVLQYAPWKLSRTCVRQQPFTFLLRPLRVCLFAMPAANKAARHCVVQLCRYTCTRLLEDTRRGFLEQPALNMRILADGDRHKVVHPDLHAHACTQLSRKARNRELAHMSTQRVHTCAHLY